MAFDPDLDDLEAHIMCVEWQCPQCGATVRAGDLEDLRHGVRAHLRTDECLSEREAIRRAQERMLRGAGQGKENPHE